MRILWLSSTPGLLNEGSGSGGYGGGGWIGALQHLFQEYNSNDSLALAYPNSVTTNKIVKDKVSYYPVYSKPINGVKKILKYYGGYKHYNREENVAEVLSVIEDYKPDIIHLFGMESPFATILGRTDVPVVVHLQGLLGPCDNAFFPIDINTSSFIWPPTMREWIFRNGYQYAKKELHTKAIHQTELFKDAHLFMGRTDFDYKISNLCSPNSQYFKVNEALRPPFYENAGKWRRHDGKFIITSTISETVYKGLDVILKTANLLKQKTNIEFEWRVVGIKEGSNFIRFFERSTEISSKNVNVRYMGVMDSSQLVENILGASVYVHPSYIDNSPNSVCEAQLIGLPVIAANVGGVSSLVSHRDTGLLVPANAPFECAYWINKLYHDVEFCEILSKRSFECANKRHDKNTIVKSLTDAYHSIVNK